MDADGPELVETGGALNIRYKGRLLYSERGPSLVPVRAALACETGPGRLYLVASPGLWYGIAELLGRLEPGSAILCAEAETGLAALSRRMAPPGLLEDKRLAFVECADPEALLGQANRLGSFRNCVPLRLSGGEAFHADGYRRASALLQAEFAASWKNRATLISMGRLWTRNIFRNLAALREIEPRPLTRFSRPVFVCGAGPSLEGALPFLVAERWRISILACDTALPALIVSGIAPDLVVCLEGQAHNLADFTPAGGQGLSLLADLSSHPATFRALSGSKHLSSVRIRPSAFLARVRALGFPFLETPPLGSVGVHAVHIARKMTSWPILAAGLDFSYELGKTHARGSPALLAEGNRMNRLYRYEAQMGAAFRKGSRHLRDGCLEAAETHSLSGTETGAMMTDPVLSSYAASLAEECQTPGPMVFTLPGRGLPIGARAIRYDEASGLIRDAYKANFAPDDPPRYQDAAQSAFRARNFIADEIARIDRLLGMMKGRNCPSREEFRSLLLESDYLLWAFPDENRVSLLPQDLLNRLLVEAQYWKWKLRDIAESASP